MPVLTSNSSLIDDFHEQGFCIARGLYDTHQLDAMASAFEELRASGGHPSHYIPLEEKFPEGDPLRTHPRVMNPHRFMPEARSWALEPRVLDVLHELFGHPPLLAQTMYYFKPPGSRGQAMHQDNFYLMVEPHTCLAAWTPLDRCDTENGALKVIPRTHLDETQCPSVQHSYLYGEANGVKIPKGVKPLTVEMEPGDTLFFNGQLIHGSGPNRSEDRWRRTFICHYADGITERLSNYYLPLVDANGNDIDREATTAGGPCAEDTWTGQPH